MYAELTEDFGIGVPQPRNAGARTTSGGGSPSQGKMVETHRLFVSLLRTMRIDIVCDVGSMDGADALRFRVAVPKSTVYAFEPNPDNFRVMEANRMLTASNIQLLPWAVTNNDGEADFFVLKTDPDGGSRGMSSLYKRSNSWPPLAAVVPVRTTRLDSFLASRIAPNDRLALWIDTEGKAFEVIEGAIGVAKQVHVVHVEVEDTPYIAANQRLYAEVMMLLTRLGFSELATDQKPSGNRNTQSKCENRGSEPWLTQFNALFIRTDLSLRMRCRVRAQLWYAWLRDVLIRALLKWCPACLRRYQEMRHRSLGRRRTRRT